MKKKVLSFILTIALVVTLGLPGSGAYVHAASTDWSLVGPDPDLNRVTCLLEFTNQIYKGTAGNGVLVWNGTAWTQAGTSFPTDQVLCIADSSGTLYAGTEMSGVWKLDNGVWTQVGASWPKTDWGSTGRANCLAEFNGTLFAGTDAGVWTLDNGVWTQVGSSWPIAYGYADMGNNFVISGGVLYVQTANNGVLKLDNGAWTLAGASWPQDYVNCIIADASGEIYAGSNQNGVYTLSGGAVWTQVGNDTQPPSVGMGVLCLADVAGTLYVGTLSDIWSWDGTDWTKAADLPFSSNANIGYRLLSTGETLYYGGSDYVYALSGSSWQEIGSYSGLPHCRYFPNRLQMTNVNGILYAGTDGVWKLNNGAWSRVGVSTWPKVEGAADRACSLIADDAGKLYAGTAKSGVWILNSGGDWTQAGTSSWPSGEGAWCLASFDGMIYAGTYHLNNNGNNAGSGVYALGSNGAWSSIGSNTGDAWLTSLTSFAGKLYVSAWASGVYVLDSGEWTSLTSGSYPNQIYSLAEANGTLYGGGYDSGDQIMLWAFNGTTWTEKTPYQSGVDTITSLKQIGGIMYAGTGNGVYSVDSSGSGITLVGNGNNLIYDLCDVAGVLYASTYNAVLGYTLESTGGSGGNGGGGGGGDTPAETLKIKTSGNTVTATTATTATVDGKGKATAAVTKDQLNAAVNSAVAEAKKQGEGTSAVVEIKVDAPANANSVETGIPKDAIGLAASGGMDALKVSTPVASISFDADALDGINKESTGDVKITTAKVDASTLTDDTKELVGDRPVFNFSVTSGNSTISEFGGNVSVAVPYALKAGEDTDAIVIYYINAEGKPEAVANCKYDPATKTISFTTNHFSKYAVGYNKVSFSDVKAGTWYGNAVEFAAARGIVTGTGNGNFSPDGKLTRGQLLVMLMRAYGIEPDTDIKDNFSDAGNTYYTGYLAAAKRLGITEGLGNNQYAPEKQITRQEMFTLLHNTLKVIGQLPEGAGKTSGDLAGYSDADSVASWAKDASVALADAGIISGSNGKLSPKNTTTRAEMAQVLYNLLSE